MRSDADELLSWLRSRREVTTDSIEGALDRVREALLIADTDMELAASLLEEALQARPNDVALRELHERLGQGVGAARAKWREEVASTLPEPAKSRLLVQAALEYERSGDTDSAARVAIATSENDELSRVIAERVATGQAASRLAEELIERAKNEADPELVREMYERLSLLDSARGDSASALLWQTAIAEKTPGWLPTLRRLEHTYIGSGRDEELEPIAMALVKRLDASEVSAHALLAARLRSRSGAWSTAREPIELAAEQDPAPLWALRALSAHARAANDDATTLRIEQRLSERATRASDAATLALRAGEAAARLGKLEEARKLLDRAVELCPEHLVALTTRAEILEALGDLGAAAEALEAVALSSAVDAHRFTAWYQAALLWIEKLENPERGERALERALQIDFDHADAIKRLGAVRRSRRARQARGASGTPPGAHHRSRTAAVARSVARPGAGRDR
jgi:tetratricopeptide (TPR) repeat protein